MLKIAKKGHKQIYEKVKINLNYLKIRQIIFGLLKY